jgi:hypothetical protein
VKTLPGDFSFDAVSPAGDIIFFIEYLSPRDPTDYAVRAYDVEAGRLLPEPIVDPTEPDEQMGGHPLARASSADGRWAYTLYDGGAHAPFVHALDTVGREARCVDLDALAGRSDLGDLRLRLTGGDLAVVRADEPIAVVDLRTFGVRAGGDAAATASGAADWRALLALAVAGAGGAVLLGRRLRRRVSPNRAATRP